MPEGDDPQHEAVSALQARGHRVEPCGDDLALWSVDGADPITDGDLIALALRLGLMDAPGRLQ